MAEQSAVTLEVELPGTGWIVTDIGSQLVFTDEFDAAMTAYCDYADFTTDELRAELARRAQTADA